ncbi:Asp23/Gls24 family envelope stress response protein [Streptomyces nojiriensis]
MTVSHRVDIQRVAAEAASGVPGVAALQPALADRLALAASRAHQALTAGTSPQREAAGVRCEHTPDDGWHVEVRCIPHADQRVVDVARQVRDDVRNAVSAYLSQQCTSDRVTVVVTVTRTL